MNIQTLMKHHKLLAPSDEATENGDTQFVDRGDEVTSPLDDVETKDEEVTDKLDEEGEETEEERQERERQEAEEAKKRRIRIPKARFDEALGKAKQREQALLEEIERLKGGKQEAARSEAVSEMRSKIDELQDKYEDLIMDGMKDEARKVRKQIDNIREELTEYQTTVKTDAARRAALDEMAYKAQLAGLESKYPAINPEHEEFDEEKTNEVAALLKAFVKDGQRRDVALARAVKYVMGSPAAPAGSPAARAVDARKKAAEANRRQPPDSRGLGLSTDKAGGKGESDIDVLRLNQKQFAKLDEETLSRLRGDIL